MSVAIPIPLLQHLPDVNVTPAVGVDEYALVYDHDTRLFVLRAPAAPFAGILATGATVGATSQAQAFTLGVVSPFLAPAADSTTAWQVRKADGTTPIVTVNTVDARVGIGTTTPPAKLAVFTAEAGNAAGLNVENIDYHDNTSTNIALTTWTETALIRLNGASGLQTIGTAGDLIISATSSGHGNILLEPVHGGFVGIGDTAPAEKLDVTGNANVTGVYKVDDVQVLSNRVIDARCADVANSGDATTDGLIDALRDAMVLHGLIAASA